MTKVNGRLDAQDRDDELPPGLARWLGIEEAISQTIEGLEALDDDCAQSIQFVQKVHAGVKAWLTWELWASLLDRDNYSPDELLVALLERGVDIRRLSSMGSEDGDRDA